MAQKLLTSSEGILGEIVALVTSAAVAALANGRERVDIDMLDDIDFKPPTDRRRAAG